MAKKKLEISRPAGAFSLLEAISLPPSYPLFVRPNPFPFSLIFMPLEFFETCVYWPEKTADVLRGHHLSDKRRDAVLVACRRPDQAVLLIG